MFDALLALELVTLLGSGAVSVGAAVFIWFRGPRTPLLTTLVLLLGFLGHLALIGALRTLPNDPGIAVHLLPVFQLAVAASCLVFLVFLFAPHLETRQIDTLLSSIAVSVLLLIALVLWRPSFYWGEGGDTGPLYAMAGIRTTLFAATAWVLAAHALSTHGYFPQLPRASAYLLSAGFALVALHDTVTDAVSAVVNGTAVTASAYLSTPLLVGLFLHLACLARFGRTAATRGRAVQYLLVGLIPALMSILIVDILVMRLVSGPRAAAFLDLVLRHLWMMALGLSTVMMLRPTRKPTPARPPAVDQLTPAHTPQGPQIRT